MDCWISRFRQTLPVDPEQPVLVPGDPERITEAERKTNGIPVNNQVIAELEELGAALSVRFG
jgi:LDH2 family malate/lactate/ureidoglycolate dehydrogenase